MYVYLITNLINQKQYIGITNNYIKRWANHISKQPKNREQVIHRAINKYGKENFKFEILFENLSVEEASEKEIQLIKEYKTKVPYGYNVADGGFYGALGITRPGYLNSNAHLSKKEVEYIRNHNDEPEYVLFQKFEGIITYAAFRNIYNGKTYKNIPIIKPLYQKNMEYTLQFTSGKLDYNDVVYLRKKYAEGIYWENVYKEFQEEYPDKWTFWNIYYGNRYHLVMPEVFTEENRKKHSSLGRQGENNGRAKLSKKDVIWLRDQYENGATRQELYRAFPNVSQTTICNVINYKTWKNI